MRDAIVDIKESELGFSAGHFTIFSATDREPLHGHNYNVSVSFKIKLHHTGLSFDYRDYKTKLRVLCDKLNMHFLLPQYSPYLKLEENKDMLFAYFDQDKIPFLKKDVVILPLSNITIEELAHWFLQKLLEYEKEIKEDGIEQIILKVHNGPGHAGAAMWDNN